MQLGLDSLPIWACEAWVGLGVTFAPGLLLLRRVGDGSYRDIPYPYQEEDGIFLPVPEDGGVPPPLLYPEGEDYGNIFPTPLDGRDGREGMVTVEVIYDDTRTMGLRGDVYLPILQLRLDCPYSTKNTAAGAIACNSQS
jgi:hypothetical protein